jgi:hypothetical protein
MGSISVDGASHLFNPGEIIELVRKLTPIQVISQCKARNLGFSKTRKTGTAYLDVIITI